MSWKKKTPEGYVKSAVIELLAAERIYYLRTNAGAQVTVDPVTGRREVIKMAPAGTADILAIPSRWMSTYRWIQPLWIETKAPGKGQSPAQKRFERERIEDGHAYIVAWSVDDVREWLINFRNAKF